MSDIAANVSDPLNGYQQRKLIEIVGWVVVSALLLLGLSSVINRMIFMQATATIDPATLNPFDRRYAELPLATWLHLLPALLIALTGPMQFIRRIRNGFRRLHRISGRTYLISGTIAALSGTYVGLFYPFTPGLNEAMASLFFGVYSLFCLYNAYRSARQKQFAKHREWVIRSWALMLAIATERTLLGIFMSTTDIDIAHLFGVTFWLAAAINIPASEYWIHLTRKASTTAKHWKDVDGR
jgi:uncharacterized membrane protein